MSDIYVDDIGKGFPFVLRFIFSGSLIGNISFGTFIMFPFLLYAIGIGHPQYLCRDTPQSRILKVIFSSPISNFFSF